MSAKATCPGTIKSCMYDYSASLRRYRELRNLSHAKCFSAAHSVEAYEHLKMVLNVQDDRKESSSGHKECMRYGPVLPQTARLDSGELEKVLDPVHVQGRGAPKKRMKKKRKRSNSKCGYCRLEGHNRRKCAKWIEVVNQTKVDFCMWLTCEYIEGSKKNCFLCRTTINLVSSLHFVLSLR
jgi:zinc finger SWIM domain-containing protein 3